MEHKRHTLAHLLAQSVLQHYPDAQLTLGPAIENGFYYDIDFGNSKITDEDLPKIQATMIQLLPTWTEFTHAEVSADDARSQFAGNEYKLELINEIESKGESITLYTCGGFTDLCRGGHCDCPATDIDPASFKLDKIAGAYWRGDSNNKMLTRIYGLAFESKAELEHYEWQMIEAEKRDHRKLGRELKLFTISELVGSGLPLWQPRGQVLRREVTEYLWQLHKDRGYQWVTTPHLAKEALYETSGHAGHYMEDMFSVWGGTSQEKFYVKPMNCPHHMQIFSADKWSYRDMPVRYFEPAVVYRDEKTGQLSGLTRVRSITQDDGHLFCRPTQIHAEVSTIVEIIKEFYLTMGMIEGYRVRLSLRDPQKPEDYLGSDEIWATAEAALTDVCKSQDLPYFEGPGEAAFYGPKLDFMFRDAIGREHQLATVQLDFNLPERFQLSYTNESGAEERPVVIHRAIGGSLERFLGVAIEHFGGSFPVWMAPVQVAILPVSEKHIDYAMQINTELRKHNVRTEMMSDETLGKRIREAKTTKIPYQIVIGDKEIESNTITVEGRNELKLAGIPLDEFVERIEEEVRDRVLN
jgi:threonyl-tRNA synthetase